MKLTEVYDEIAQDATIDREKHEFDRSLVKFLQSAKELGLSRERVMAIINDMMARTGLDEAFGEQRSVDAQQIAKALVMVARDQFPDPKFQVNAAKQMADNLNKRIKAAIEEFDKASTWIG